MNNINFNPFFFILSIVVLLILLAHKSIAQNIDRFELVDIRFNGNKTFSNSELLEQIESKKTPWWFWKFLRSFTPLGSEEQYFDSLLISPDTNSLLNFYLVNGFFQTKINTSIITDSLKKEVTLVFNINEGEQSSFGKLIIIGLDELLDYEKEFISKQFTNITEKKTFRQREINNSINEVLRYLADNGYLFAKHDSTVVFKDTVKLKADVNVYITTGKKYIIDQIIINKSGVGSNQVSDKLIKDIAALRPKEIFNQSKLERSEIRLLRTGIFNSVSINPAIKNIQGNRLPIEIITQVGTLNELSPELKIDNDFNSFNTGLGINFIRKNFLGDARKFTAATSFRIIDILTFDARKIFGSNNQMTGYQGVIDLEFGLEQPYLFGNPILTTTKSYYRSSTFKTDTEKLIGANQSFDIEMPVHTFITLMKPQITLEQIEFDLKFLREELSVFAKSLTPSVGIELGSYKTNDLFFPISGYNFYFYPEIFQSRTQVRILGKDTSSSVTQTGWFWKIQSSLANFLSVSRDNNGALGLKIKVGYIHSLYGKYDLIPPNRTFFSGGSNSIRGWRLRELLPPEEIEYFGIRRRQDDTPRGGTFLFESSVEFRRKFEKDFGFAIFFDLGNVWNNINKININQFAAATGLGLRYYSPIAPIRIDFGLKLFNPKDKKFIFNKKLLTNIEFHFGIGEAF